jgi:AraC-like DNA-binding protein
METSRLVTGSIFRRLLVARDFIESAHTEPLALREIARHAGLSPYHFLRLFHQAFDETPHQYATRLRLTHAKRLLSLGTPVTEACFEVGYASIGSFSSLFAREEGLSPSAYQRRVRRLVQVPKELARLYIPSCFLTFFTRPKD